MANSRGQSSFAITIKYVVHETLIVEGQNRYFFVLFVFFFVFKERCPNFFFILTFGSSLFISLLPLPTFASYHVT